MMRTAGTWLLAGLLSGCSVMSNSQKNTVLNFPWLISDNGAQPEDCEPLSKEQELVLNLSRKMVKDGRLHAALANMELLPTSLPEARLGKARILRVLNRPEAEALYQSLLDTCLVASGYHGLAQLAVVGERSRQALTYMKKAISLTPTNDAMRNDLGVIYLDLRLLEEARFELLTAIELNENGRRALGNLLTLLIYQDKLEQAGWLVSRYRVSPEQYRKAVTRAQRLHREDMADNELISKIDNG